MQGYAESTECRRNLLLAYFGEKSKEKCGQCDNCRVTEKSWDASTAVKKFLSTVWRSYEKSKLYLNAAQVIEILQGIETPFNRQHDFQELSTWKIGVEFSEQPAACGLPLSAFERSFGGGIYFRQRAFLNR